MKFLLKNNASKLFTSKMIFVMYARNFINLICDHFICQITFTKFFNATIKSFKMMPQMSAVVCSFICLIMFFLCRKIAISFMFAEFDKKSSKNSICNLKQVLNKLVIVSKLKNLRNHNLRIFLHHRRMTFHIWKQKEKKLFFVPTKQQYYVKIRN